MIDMYLIIHNYKLYMNVLGSIWLYIMILELMFMCWWNCIKLIIQIRQMVWMAMVMKDNNSLHTPLLTPAAWHHSLLPSPSVFPPLLLPSSLLHLLRPRQRPWAVVTKKKIGISKKTNLTYMQCQVRSLIFHNFFSQHYNL